VADRAQRGRAERAARGGGRPAVGGAAVHGRDLQRTRGANWGGRVGIFSEGPPTFTGPTYPARRGPQASGCRRTGVWQGSRVGRNATATRQQWRDRPLNAIRACENRGWDDASSHFPRGCARAGWGRGEGSQEGFPEGGRRFRVTPPRRAPEGWVRWRVPDRGRCPDVDAVGGTGVDAGRRAAWTLEVPPPFHTPSPSPLPLRAIPLLPPSVARGRPWVGVGFVR
jgi:hypothetical protein